MWSFDQLLFLLIALTITITVHEAAHAWMANRLGDPTARYLGRISLNPAVHLDPLGTIMIFIAGFGWGKPVPYNPRNLKNPHVDALWIALAGPAANFLCALLFTLPLKYLSFGDSGLAMYLTQVFAYTVQLNIVLMVFNLLPIPPLDGSKVLMAIAPDKYRHDLDIFFMYGPYILLGLILFDNFFRIHILSAMLNPLIEYVWMFIHLIT